MFLNEALYFHFAPVPSAVEIVCTITGAVLAFAFTMDNIGGGGADMQRSPVNNLAWACASESKFSGCNLMVIRGRSGSFTCVSCAM